MHNYRLEMITEKEEVKEQRLNQTKDKIETYLNDANEIYVKVFYM